jgi:hypothetical protein
MNSIDRPCFPQKPLEAVPEVLLAVLLLWQHYRFAKTAGENPWDYAVSEATLRAIGIADYQLRGLIEAQFIDYAIHSAPRFQDAPAPMTHPSSHGAAQVYTLTDAGAAFVEEVLVTVESKKGFTAPPGNNHAPHAKPHWDAERRELSYRGVIVKRFHKPAPNQELILAAFEESGWPQRIDDPLPPQGDIVPSVRLHDTLGRLNRTLQNSIIHFGQNGNGQVIYWRLS